MGGGSDRSSSISSSRSSRGSAQPGFNRWVATAIPHKHTHAQPHPHAHSHTPHLERGKVLCGVVHHLDLEAAKARGADLGEVDLGQLGNLVVMSVVESPTAQCSAW